MMIRIASSPRYGSDEGEKLLLIQLCVDGNIDATVGGSAMIAAAKMTGMTPAMFTRSGMYVALPVVIRRPTMRLAYWIGIRRWPSWTKTTATMIASATIGKKSFS